MIHQNILETIGNTPLVRINNIVENKNVKIYAKLEGTNPGGSVKDRIALQMITSAESSGQLTKGKIIIEPTSGNTGIGLAIVAIVKGYRIQIVMSRAVSKERRKILSAFGAELILTKAGLGTDGAIMRARELVKKYPEKYFMPDQFSNYNNIMAHYKNTAREIWQQTNGKVDYFVSAIGTSGTIMGVGKYLKEKNANIKIISAHPIRGHHIQGLKNMKEAVVPAIYNKSVIDKTIFVKDEQAYSMARDIIKKEGIFVGMSSGAAMAVAAKIAKKIKKGNIVVIFPDRGEKYLSTKLFT